MTKIRLGGFAAGVLCAGVAGAAGNVATATFQVTATVAASCTAAVPTLAFGTYTPGGGTSYQQGSTVLTMKCTTGAQPTVSLSAGGGTFAQRQMQSTATPAHKLSYQLYTAATTTVAGANVWGDGSGTTKTVQTAVSTGTGAPLTLTIYGLIHDAMGANQTAFPATDYTDSITATLNY